MITQVSLVLNKTVFDSDWPFHLVFINVIFRIIFLAFYFFFLQCSLGMEFHNLNVAAEMVEILKDYQSQ